VNCAETAEPIEMPFGIGFGWAKEACVRRSVHRGNLANINEPFMYGCDAACYQITLTTFFIRRLLDTFTPHRHFYKLLAFDSKFIAATMSLAVP